MDQQQQFDSELQTYFLKIKHDIKQEHIAYLNQHPELKQIMNDFTSQILLEKPENVYEYARKYFSYFNHSNDQAKLKPLVISGPSGVGKGTLIEKLFLKYPEYFQFSVSYTTRKPRPGEIHGKHYYFVSKDEFQKEVDKEAFVEYCEVHGNFYGTHLAQLNEIRKQGMICILEIDVQGAEKVLRKLPDQCNYLFINGPSIAVIRQRLTSRGTETPEVINKRIEAVNKEVKKSQELNVYTEIINDKLDLAFEQLQMYLKEQYPELKW